MSLFSHDSADTVRKFTSIMQAISSTEISTEIATNSNDRLAVAVQYDHSNRTCLIMTNVGTVLTCISHHDTKEYSDLIKCTLSDYADKILASFGSVAANKNFFSEEEAGLFLIQHTQEWYQQVYPSRYGAVSAFQTWQAVERLQKKLQGHALIHKLNDKPHHDILINVKPLSALIMLDFLQNY